MSFINLSFYNLGQYSFYIDLTIYLPIAISRYLILIELTLKVVANTVLQIDNLSFFILSI